MHDLEQIFIVREKTILADCWVITPKLLSLENENLMMWCEHRNEIHNLRFETRLWKPALEKADELVDYVKEKMLTSMTESLFRKKDLLVYC